MKIILNDRQIILIRDALTNEKHRLMESDKAVKDRPVLTEGRLKNIANLDDLIRYIATPKNYV